MSLTFIGSPACQDVHDGQCIFISYFYPLLMLFWSPFLENISTSASRHVGTSNLALINVVIKIPFSLGMRTQWYILFTLVNSLENWGYWCGKVKKNCCACEKKVNAGTVERCSDRDSSHRSPLMLPQSREESQRDASRKYREGWG